MKELSNYFKSSYKYDIIKKIKLKGESHEKENNNRITWGCWGKKFKSFQINLSHYGIYALLASIIIYVLNQTIKPIINYITLPLTIMSWGLLYPLSNVIILYLTSLILGTKNFYLSGFFAPFIIAIIISFLNILMEGLVLKPITKGTNKNG